jgi:hypothetical protein
LILLARQLSYRVLPQVIRGASIMLAANSFPVSRPARKLLLTAMLAFSIGLLAGHYLRPDRKTPLSPASPSDTSSLVRSLLSENLDRRRFRFSEVVSATSGKRAIPLDPSDPVHQRILDAIEQAVAESVDLHNRPDSPVRGLRRINEASRHFEDAILSHLNQHNGIACGIPANRRGEEQRSGYPDLRITDQETGTVFYLDPKLVDRTSWQSTLRSFYFAPKTGTLKITDDAVHLLVGISHDGNDGAWTFGQFKLVDLSALQVRLKAEFQASNTDLYPTP